MDYYTAGSIIHGADIDVLSGSEYLYVRIFIQFFQRNQLVFSLCVLACLLFTTLRHVSIIVRFIID